jgi:heparan-alpha-glucosaminide N-acetyltransferase
MTTATTAPAGVADPGLPAVPQRLVSLDAYRGFVMFLMMAEVLRLAQVAAAVPGSVFWSFVAFHQTHAPWAGCSLHDLIQPSFSFMVGVAVPYSMASRLARGQSKGFMTLHAFWRAFILVILGIFLRSMGHAVTRFTFEDTLTQIGLGYGVLFLLGFRKTRDAWVALALILVGYWAAFALYPLPGPDFDWKAAGASADWAYNYHGFAAHWNKNTNLAWAFDRWFLNLFPPDGWFRFNGGGYATLSFIPTLGTMILGLVAGRVMRSDRTPRQRIVWLVAAGVIGIAAGWLLDVTGVCPSVKRIWTPGWTLFSGGWCFLLLAAFYAVIDLAGWRKPAFWLVVIGMNSIAAYMIAHLLESPLEGTLRTHLGARVFTAFGEPYEPFVTGLCVLAGYWLILLWMYRRKIFLRI